MIPLFDPDGDLPQGMHQTTWTAFRERFCIFARSDRRLRLCRQIEQMLEEAQASRIVERLIFGESFVTSKSEPNDFDCIFAYPWPGEDDVVTSIFDAYAARGAVLLTFHGQDGLIARRKSR